MAGTALRTSSSAVTVAIPPLLAFAMRPLPHLDDRLLNTLEQQDFLTANGVQTLSPGTLSVALG